MQFSIWERIVLANEMRKQTDDLDEIAKRYAVKAQSEIKEAASVNPDELLSG